MKTSVQLFSVFVMCICASAFIGCSEDTMMDMVPKRILPKAGSTYTYVRTEKANASPFATVSGSDTVHIVTSLANYTSFAGKDSVISFSDVNTMNTAAAPDTMTIAYESNGDVSIYRGNGFEGLPDGLPISVPIWWTLPFKSKTTVTIMEQVVGLTFDLGVVSVTIDSVNGVSKGAATTSNYTVGDKVYECDQADVTFTVFGKVNTPFVVPVTLVFNTKYLLNEEIGYFILFDTQNDLGLASNLFDPDNNIQVLTSFIVKN